MGRMGEELGFDSRQKQKLFSSPQGPQRLWVSPSFLSKWEFLHLGYSGMVLNLAADHLIVTIMVGLHLHSFIRLHGVELIN
jgi:hypothetical protein